PPWPHGSPSRRWPWSASPATPRALAWRLRLHPAGDVEQSIAAQRLADDARRDGDPCRREVHAVGLAHDLHTAVVADRVPVAVAGSDDAGDALDGADAAVEPAGGEPHAGVLGAGHDRLGRRPRN